MDYSFKLLDFKVFNNVCIQSDSEEDDNETIKKDNLQLNVQMFGLNENGETASIMIEDYSPFFYLKVDNNWGQTKKNALLKHFKSKLGKYYEDSITSFKLIERKKLNMYDAGKKHRFIEVKFTNTNAFNKLKNFWYGDEINEEGNKERRLISKGYKFEHEGQTTYVELYESFIPPLLRFFHIQEISPSGWVLLPTKCTKLMLNKTTSCDYEFKINHKSIIPLNDKEDPVPYKVMSFDIEASSSHGDFPVPIKSYKKLATNIVDYFDKLNGNKSIDITPVACKQILFDIIKSAFGFSTMDEIDIVYPKEPIHNEEELSTRFNQWIKSKVRDCKNENSDERVIELMFETAQKLMKEKDAEKDDDGGENTDDESDDDNDNSNDVAEDEQKWKSAVNSEIKKYKQTYKNEESTIVDVLCDSKFERDGKISELIRSLRNHFPQLEGDKVTFIGSTFRKYGQAETCLENCIVLNSCDRVDGVEIECYDTEKEVLLAWTNLVQRENPDIIIGYNIFSFDYEFMFRRSQELFCTEDFLKLSRNNGEICGSEDYKNPGKIDIERSSTTLASGTFDLSIIKMNGRLQVDLLNWFRRTENLTSYKLDYVAGHCIGDEVKSIEHRIDENGNEVTRVNTSNMVGLKEECYIHFEEINHSSDYYKDGKKLKVIRVNKNDCWFEINGTENPHAKTIKWGLAKDDVTPKDIFRMTNEGPSARAVVAKYCIQDCNLVHHLFNKVDVITDLVEMSKLCSVPMSFLVFRGQGIKLTSYVAKKCREKGVLMPTINKGSIYDIYDGAIVLNPKCGLYLEDPVPVGDFASLYPSSMLSENLCPTSKVWTQTYDLANNLVAETGEKGKDGNYLYDNLPGVEYVSIRFDTYGFVKKNDTYCSVKKNIKTRLEKVKNGYKICRYAQPTINEHGVEEKAIMPSILIECLKARKDTRALIKVTPDAFMKNVLEKRQLGFKGLANSLYGQFGAKTSTFYEPDIAASTTAVGRMLLTFAKKVIEECYKNVDIDTKYGLVNTQSEYIYGDSVANYTPVYVKVNNNINILTIEHLAEKYGNNNWVKCLEEGKQDKEFCELENVETWTEKGWTRLYRVIRHELASHKKMIRILTHTGCVDVTDDHSLVKSDGSEISPNECTDETELLHYPLLEKMEQNIYDNEEIFTGHFDNMIEASMYVNYLNIKGIKFRLNSGNDLSIVVVPNPIGSRNEIAVKKLNEIEYSGYVYDLTTENHHFAAGVGDLIVHNTDSVFFKFELTDKETNKKITGEKALELSIEIAQEACHNVSKVLKGPHDFEYEKTFYPLCLLSKKRYSTIKYTFDPKKGKSEDMGNVLKRRDNSPIVKDIYGGVKSILMKERNLQMAIDFVNRSLQDLIDGKVPIEKLIISKSLRSFYKNPKGVAHKVLADRIGEREPGNKPTSGDRIQYVYIVTKPPPKGTKVLQGDKIETPTFIKENNLQIDYSYYITNQIMKPLLQLFSLVLTDIWMSQKPPRRAKVTKFNEEINKVRETITDSVKCEKKISNMKNKEVEELIFSKYLRETNNVKNGNQNISKFFVKK